MEIMSIKKFIAELLTSKGWVPVSDFDMQNTYAVAQKCYETAVGTKECHVYLLSMTGGGFQLVGNYLSEGRNVLSTTWQDIPDGLVSEQTRADIEGFSDRVDAEIDQSYARRLFLNRS